MITPISNPAPLAPALPLEPVTQQPRESSQTQKNWDALFRSLPRLGGVATSIFVGLGGLSKLVGRVRPVGLVRPMVLGTIVGGTIELGLLMLERQQENSVYANHSWLDLAKLAFWDDAFSATLNLAIGRTVGLGLGNVHSITRGILVNLAIGEVQALKNLDTTHGNEDRLIAMISGALGGAWAPWLQHRAKTELGFEIVREFGESLAQIKFDRQSPGKLTTDVMIESLVMSFSEVGGSLAGHRGGVRVKTPQPTTTITRLQPQFAGSVATAPSERSPVITGAIADYQLDPSATKSLANFYAEYRLHELFAERPKISTDPLQVLFVCTGNTHRSAAMHLTLAQLQRDGYGRFNIRSAGLQVEPESQIDPVLARVAEVSGIHPDIIHDFQPQQLTRQQIDEAEVILCTAEDHRDQLATRFPDAQAKLFLFNELAPKAFASDSLSIPDPIGSEAATLDMFEAVQNGMQQEIRRVLSRRKSYKSSPEYQLAVSTRDSLPASWTETERDIFVYLMTITNPHEHSDRPRAFCEAAHLFPDHWSTRQIIDCCAVLENHLVRSSMSENTINGEVKDLLEKYGTVLTPAEMIQIFYDDVNSSYSIHTNSLIYDRLPSTWPHPLRYKITRVLLHCYLYPNAAYTVLDDVDLVMENPRMDDSERALVWDYLKEQIKDPDYRTHQTTQAVLGGLYHKASLFVQNFGISVTRNARVVLKLTERLTSLIECKSWLRALHVIDYLKATKQLVDPELEATVRHQAALEQAALADHQPRRVMPTRPIHVKSEIIAFYAIQAIHTRLTKLEAYQCDEATQQQITELKKQLALRQQQITRWMRDYLVYAVARELRHQDDTSLAWQGKKVFVPLYGRGFVNSLTFLKHAQPHDVRWFLTQAASAFTQGHWEFQFGGKRWKDIAIYARKLWNGAPVTTTTLDAIFNLEHNTKTVFDKWEDAVKRQGIDEALELKKQAANLDTVMIAARSLGIDAAAATTLTSWQARLKAIEDSLGDVDDAQVGLVPPIIKVGNTLDAIGEVQWMVGRVRMQPKDFQPGDILVCKEITPEIHKLLPQAGGIIVNEGNLLSHAMIVAREYDIPAVILPQLKIRHGYGKKEGSDTTIFRDASVTRLHAQGGLAVVRSLHLQPYPTLAETDQLCLQDLLHTPSPPQKSIDHLQKLPADRLAALKEQTKPIITACLDTIDQLLRHPKLSDAYVVKRAQELIAGIKRIAPYTDYDDTALQKYDALITARTPTPQLPPTQPTAAPLPTLVTSLDQIGLEHSTQVGAKAATLGYLQNQEINATIPKGVSLSIDVFERYLDQSGIRQKFEQLQTHLKSALDDNHQGGIQAYSESIRELILTNPLQAQSALVASLEDAFDAQDLTPRTRLAIRSSAVCEDQPNASHAGMANTYLNVDKKDWFTRTTEVWASFWEEHAVRYRHQRGLSPDQVSPAILMQEMVNAQASGVVFTRHPVNTRDEIVITLAEGAGRGVESEAMNQITVSNQNHVSFDTIPIINETQVLRLAELAREVKEKLGYEVDMEYAVIDDEIYLLQARPMTGYN